MMVRIYISPGGIGTYLWDQQSFENNRGEAQEAQDVIESLMREPPMLPHTKHDEILLCYGKLMTRQKEDIDYVLRKCLKIIEVETAVRTRFALHVCSTQDDQSERKGSKSVETYL